MKQARATQVPATGPPSPSTLTMEMFLHDLAAPLRHMDFFVHELQRSIPAPAADQAEMFRRMNHNLRTAHARLEDGRLLFSGQNEPSPGALRPARVNRHLRDVADSFREDSQLQGVTWRVELGDDEPVRGDPRALGRVVFNLLSNALRATPKGGTVVLSSRRRGDQMVFAVADTGHGFTTEVADALRRRILDLDTGRDPLAAWGGLGLLVCHRTLLRHGSQLELLSPGEGLGATFSFELSIAAPD